MAARSKALMARSSMIDRSSPSFSVSGSRRTVVWQNCHTTGACSSWRSVGADSGADSPFQVGGDLGDAVVARGVGRGLLHDFLFRTTVRFEVAVHPDITAAHVFFGFGHRVSPR